ncbi:MAG: hypothetical protein JO227_16170 [Acetobacteraceae bacterium]|nr:hypothetical protein [Acetobacteraceae bacterium]
MQRRLSRHVANVALIGAVAACSAQGTQQSAQELSRRLTERLQPQINAGQAAVSPLQDGARVQLSDRVLFPPGGRDLNGEGRYALSSVTEGLLNPGLMNLLIQPAESNAVGQVGSLAWSRAQTLEAFYKEGPFLAFPLASVTLDSTPGSASSPTSISQAMAISVQVR